jgi:outer membrane cobalamin receptor
MPSGTAPHSRDGREDGAPTTQRFPYATTRAIARGLRVASIAALGVAGWATPAPALGAEQAREPASASSSVAAATAPAFESVVSGARTPPHAAREDLAAASTVLLPADSPRARDDLGGLLVEVPGANVTRRGGLGAGATISLRGSNPDEVRIYLDGVPLNQAVGGAVDLSTLPLGDVERVEVYRGSTPIAFGESALGGVVSISTRTPGGPTRTSLRAGAGSFRTSFADATGGGELGRLRLYAGLHVLRAIGDFPDAPNNVPEGFQPTSRQNDDLTQLDGVVRVALALPGRRELRLGVIGIGRDQGLPAQNIFRSQARATTARGVVHFDYESRDDLGASSRLRTLIFLAATRDVFSDPLRQIAGVPTATRDVTRTLGGTASAEKALGGWGRVTAVIEARGEEFLPHNDFDPNMPTGYPATRTVGAAGTELDAHLARVGLHVIPSVRVEVSHDVRTGRDTLFGAQQPPAPAIDRVLPILRLGLLRPFASGVTVRANVGRYTRIPSFLELYGYNRGVLGNPQLVPERGLNADLQLAYASRSSAPGLASEWSAALTAFGSRVDDLIEWHPTSYQTRAENIARARVWGVEAEARWRGRHLGATAQGTLTDARDEGEVLAARDRQLVFHPRYRGYARLEWRQSLGRSRLVAGAYADVDATAGNHSAPTFGDIPPQALLGAGVSLEHAPTGLRLIASAANLADDRTQTFRDYPLPGRTLFVSLGWSSGTPPPSAVPN